MDDFSRIELKAESKETIKDIIAVFQTLNIGNNPQFTGAIEALSNKLDSTNRLEKDIEKFAFRVPNSTLQDHIVSLGAARPERGRHYLDRNGVLYKNDNQESHEYLDPDTAAWKAKSDFLAANPQATQAQLTAEADRARVEQDGKNRKAAYATPNWILVEREASNDARGEDVLLNFLDSEHKIVDWHKVVYSIKKFGEPLGYSLNHYKQCFDRFISFFSPELKTVTDPMDATELAKFLLRTSIPPSKYEKLTGQMATIVRNPGTALMAVINKLEGIGKAYYADKPKDEQNSAINKLLLHGLVSFTAGPTNKSVLNTINLAQMKGKELHWHELIDAITNSEAIHGPPLVPLHFQQQLRNSVDIFHSTFSPVAQNVDYLPTSTSYPLDPFYNFYNPHTESTSHSYTGTHPTARNLVRMPVHIPTPHRHPNPPPTPPHPLPQPQFAQPDIPMPQPQFQSPPPSNPLPPTPSRNLSKLKAEPQTPRVENQERRRSSRSRKSTSHYDAATGVNINTVSMSNSDRSNSRDRKDSRDNSYDRKRNSSRDKYKNRDRSQDRYRNNSRQRYDRNRSKDRRPDSRYRNNSSDRYRKSSGERYRDQSKDRRNRDRYRSRSLSRDRYSYKKDRSQSPYDRKKYSSDNRPSRNDRSRYNDRSRSRDRKYSRNNTPSKNDKFGDFIPGVNASNDYKPESQKHCMKCFSKSEHHEFRCPTYFRVAARQCSMCNKGYHFDADCKNKRERSRSNSRNAKGNF